MLKQKIKLRFRVQLRAHITGASVKYDKALANFCIQYREKVVFLYKLSDNCVNVLLLIDPLCVAFGGTCRITEWRISGAYHKLDWNILWAKKGATRGEGMGA